MSSSSSLAGARRRRAGGGSGPTSTGTANRQGAPQTGAQQQQRPQQQVSPFAVLQQHHVKIIDLERKINQILSSEIPRSLSGDGNVKMEINESANVTNGNIAEITGLIMENIENQFDFKALYENDERLSNEINELKNMYVQQQDMMNKLNTLFYNLLGKMDISSRRIETLEQSQGTDEIEHALGERSPSPRSVVIDENNNEIKEFSPMDDNNESNFEPLQ